jgi:hypothetical protein
MHASSQTVRSSVGHKGALYFSLGYGAVALLIYLIGILSGGDGPTAAFLIVYYSAWPISILFNVAVSLLGHSFPAFAPLYSASPIAAGVMWSYFIARCVLALKTRLTAPRGPRI